MKVIVIGGGTRLMASVSAAIHGAKSSCFEKINPWKKLLHTGGTRCNVQIVPRRNRETFREMDASYIVPFRNLIIRILFSS